MDYFVSIEDTNYFAWQTELLIQSFKNLGMEDNLVIGIAPHSETKLFQYYKNLLQHKRKFYHENVGRLNHYPALNRPFAISTALLLGHIQSPFTVIHADMVITKPPTLDVPPSSIHYEIEYVDPIVDLKIQPYARPIIDVKGMTEIPRFPIGSAMIFKDVPQYFFNRAYQRTLQLLADTGNDWDVEQGAWLLTSYEHLGSLSLVAGINYTCPMVANDIPTPFIHYKHGTSPNFHKYHFMYDNFSMMSLGTPDPYTAIKLQAPVAATVFLQKLIKQVEET